MRMTDTLRYARSWRRRLPRRIALGAAVATAAVAALAWQHHHDTSTVAEPTPPSARSAAPAAVPDTGDLGDTSAGQLVAPTVNADALSPVDARAAATRLATNFGSPNGNRDDWLARISPDLSDQLIGQYRLTDIRNVPQAAVSAVDGPVRQAPASFTFDVTYDDGSRIEIREETGPLGWKAVEVAPLSGYGLPAAVTPGDAEGTP